MEYKYLFEVSIIYIMVAKLYLYFYLIYYFSKIFLLIKDHQIYLILVLKEQYYIDYYFHYKYIFNNEYLSQTNHHLIH